jgi:large subunit ribosomal protein L23
MLLKPLITEKSLAGTASRRYSFLVELLDTKTKIKADVEKAFGVKVISVRTMHIHGKTYRTGKRGLHAKAADHKKAIVTIKPDQKIELFDTPEAK